MRRQAILAVSLLTVLATACGSAQEEPQVIEQIVVREPGETEVAAPAASAGAASLVALGEDAFQMCTGCHAFEAGAPSAAGPNLHGVVGRKAASLSDYPYSDALAASGITWDEDSLERYLADPAGYVPGTDMLAGAVPDAASRAAIIAYLAGAGE
jgi:cytochrome c